MIVIGILKQLIFFLHGLKWIDLPNCDAYVIWMYEIHNDDS